MSTPHNHHYVSRCQQQEFFNFEEKRIYVYDKKLDNIYHRSSTKNLFSDKDINSKELNGQVNHDYLEKELKFLVEDNYPNNVLILKQFLKDQSNLNQATEALLWLTSVGILGQLRHPLYKENIENSVGEMIAKSLSHVTGFSSEQIKPILESWKKTKFHNDLNYSNMLLSTLERMEPIDFKVFFIESNDYFILPDTSGFLVRGQLQQYLNPYINEIIGIGVPVSSKIFVLCTSKRLGETPNGIHFIHSNDNEIVYEINKDIYDFSYKAVACPNKEFLYHFKEKVRADKGK